jgi:hypothetical protein
MLTVEIYGTMTMRLRIGAMRVYPVSTVKAKVTGMKLTWDSVRRVHITARECITDVSGFQEAV